MLPKLVHPRAHCVEDMGHFEVKDFSTGSFTLAHTHFLTWLRNSSSSEMFFFGACCSDTIRRQSGIVE
jgi:hypothetical protein